jgi:hypothetical protein
MTKQELFDWARGEDWTVTLAGEIGGRSRMVAEGLGESVELDSAGRCVHVDGRRVRRVASVHELH